MLDASLIQQLKRTSISKDAEKTKQRFGELWKAASASDKETIENLTGVGRPSLQRIYKEGGISAKIVAAVSQAMNVNPYYLTGETDESGESTEQGLVEFLQKSGYGDLLTAYRTEPKARKPRKKREAKDKTAPVSETIPEVSPVDGAEGSAQPTEMLVVEMITSEPETASSKMLGSTFFDEFCEDDIILLIRSVKIRANAGVAAAIKQAEELRKTLLS